MPHTDGLVIQGWTWSRRPSHRLSISLKHVLPSNEPHQWSLFGVKRGGWVSSVVKPGKLITLGHCHERTRQELYPHHGRGHNLLAGNVPSKPCHCLEHDFKSWKTHFVGFLTWVFSPKYWFCLQVLFPSSHHFWVVCLCFGNFVCLFFPR